MPLDVAYLPATTTFNVEQALASAMQMNLTDCVIIGYDPDGDLVVRSSRMNRAEALWLIEATRQHVIESQLELRNPHAG